MLKIKVNKEKQANKPNLTYKPNVKYDVMSFVLRTKKAEEKRIYSPNSKNLLNSFLLVILAYI